VPAGPDGTVTYRQLLAEAAERFAAAGLPSPEADARRVMEEVTGADGASLALALSDAATELRVARFDDLVRRRCDGEPLQYVLGHWSFRHLDLLVDRRVLIPRPETELVAELAIELARTLPRPLACADLGTGSGAIGLSLLRELPRGSVEVWLTDMSLDALDVARANGTGLGIAGAGARYAHGSWFDALPESLRGGVGLIVSNPPYIAEGDPAVDRSVHDWEPGGALYSGADGLDAVRVLAGGAPSWLQPGGWLVLEHGATQGAATRQCLLRAGLTAVSTLTDLQGLERVTLGQWPGTPR